MKAEDKIETYLQETRQLLAEEKQNDFFKGAIYAFEKSLEIVRGEKDEK